MTNHRASTTVGVVGTGVIGRSWVRVFSRAGCETRVWDADADSLGRAFEWHENEMARETADVASSGGGGVAAGRVVACSTLEDALAGAAYVQESVPEALAAKQAIFARLDRIAAPDTILASSTSAISMSEIAAGLPGARRCIVAHPVNPPHVVPVVEVLGGEQTDRTVVDRTMSFLRSVGQIPVLLNFFVPGFLLNRMQAALVREAGDLLARGVADADAIDAVIRDGLGLRWALMGPFGVANTNADGGVREYFTRYGSSYAELWADLRTTVAFDPELIERIGSQTDAMENGTSREGRRQWRDRMVQRIRRLKGESA